MPTGQPLDRSWIPGQPSAMSWTSVQAPDRSGFGFLSNFAGLGSPTIFDKNAFEKQKCVFPGTFRTHTGSGRAHMGPKNPKEYVTDLLY